MSRPDYYIGLYGLLVCILMMCSSFIMQAVGQIPDKIDSSSTKLIRQGLLNFKDQFLSSRDSLNFRKLLKQEHPFKVLQRRVDSITKYSSAKFDSSRKGNLRIDSIFNKNKFVAFYGGSVAYHLNYRSTVDTPFVDKNISQHIATGNLQFMLASTVPLRVQYFLRNSNSSIFRDIYDVRVQYDGNGIKNQLQEELNNAVSSSMADLRDPLSEELYDFKLQEWAELRGYLNSGSFTQLLVDANKTLTIPAFSYDRSLPDSLATAKSDTLRVKAKTFIKEYNEKKRYLDSLSLEIDSLKQQLQNISAKIYQLKNLDVAGLRDWASFQAFQKMQSQIGTKVQVPKKFQWLLGLRQFAVGRNQINYSELTAKYLSITGINFEYNTWYYVALSAGLVDFRFRDFAIRPARITKQYMYLLRLGIGQLSKDYFIVSAFKGQKQLYAASQSSAGLSRVSVSGIAAEGKWQVSQNSYMLGEVAQSFSPNLRDEPSTSKNAWDFSDKTNKAYSVRWYSYFRRFGSRLDAMYRYTGSNYQSFSNFQTNATYKAWNIRAEQSLFGRQLRISAAIRSNDFSNPYLIQSYAGNNVFKSVYASFRRKKWPTISIGYLPSSQITKVDNQFFETRFHTFNTAVNHYYKLGLITAASTVIYNQFDNKSADTGFIYFNAKNIIASQNFFFEDFTSNLSVSTTHSPVYSLVVVDENVQFDVFDWGQTTIGAKVNRLNSTIVKLGFYGSTQIKVFKNDFIYLNYDRGFLPTNTGTLIPNDFVQICFTKNFK